MHVPRRRPPVIKLFRITFTYGSDTYTVIPLDPDPAVASKAFRFHKHSDDQPVYDIRETDHGAECDCTGFTYRGHCRHIRMLLLARMIDQPGRVHP
jgi:hypothetical protein